MKHTLNYALRPLRIQNTHPVQQLLFEPLKDESNTLLELDLEIFGQLDKAKNQLIRNGNFLKLIAKFQKLEGISSAWMAPWDSPPLVIKISSLTKTLAHEQHLKLMQTIDPDIAIAYTYGSLPKSNVSSIGFVIYMPFTRELKSFSFNLGNFIGITDTETYCIYKAAQYLRKKLLNAR